MNLVDRLAANSTWEPNSGCRIWLGALSRDHGVMKVGGKMHQVHRVAWELERGAIPKGLWVLHACGLSPCLNVNHLRLGTQEENAADRTAHGGYLGKVGGGLMSQVRVSDAGMPSFDRVSSAPLDQNELRRILSYDPATGAFRHRLRADRDRSWNARFSGEIAGAILENGYRYLNFRTKLRTAHRLAWLYMTGSLPAGQIDHINGDRADNRWANLRLATQAQNSANQGLRTNNKSGVKGVSWDAKAGQWRAQITHNGKAHFLGFFRTLEAATIARRTAEDAYHGDYVRHGVN